MNRRWLFPTAFAAMLIMLPACNRRPKGVLSDDKMVDVMVDLKLAENYAMQHPGDPADSLSLRLAASVLDSHGVSRADFDTTVAWYGRHFDEYVLLYDRMEKRLSERQKSFLADDVVSLSEGDNLWPYSRRIIISPLGSSDGFSFSLDATEVKPGEVLKWRMSSENPAAGKFVFGVEYTDGTSDYVSRTSGASGMMEYSLPVDSVLKPKRIFGSYHIPMHYLPIRLDSLSLTHGAAPKDPAARPASPVRYKKPEKFDAAKARMKERADSLVQASDSARAADSEEETDGILRASRNMNRRNVGRPGR